MKRAIIERCSERLTASVKAKEKREQCEPRLGYSFKTWIAGLNLSCLELVVSLQGLAFDKEKIRIWPLRPIRPYLPNSLGKTVRL